jgi:hypothetical protein
MFKQVSAHPIVAAGHGITGIQISLPVHRRESLTATHLLGLRVGVASGLTLALLMPLRLPFRLLVDN